MKNRLVTTLLVLLLFTSILAILNVAGTEDVTLTLSDSELATQFGKQWGPGTLASITDIAGPGVQYNFTGLTGSGTGVGDNYPVSQLAGGALDGLGGWGDFRAYTQYRLMFTNIGLNPVSVNIFMNTGFGGGVIDTYWGNGWIYLGVGENKVVTLDFSSVGEVWNAHDDPVLEWRYPGGTSGVSVRRLDEVTNIGFQVTGSGAGSIVVSATTPDLTLTLSDSELGTQFAYEWGPGTLASVTDIAGPGVQFNFTGLDPSSGTVVGDNFPVSSLAGGAHKDYGSGFAGPYDFSAYTRYMLVFTNVGTTPVTINLKINTGWTNAPWGDLSRDTFWQNSWTNLAPNESRVITLDFCSAEVWHATDDPVSAWQYPDGTAGVIVRRLDEVSDIGFQILGNDAASIVVTNIYESILTLSDAELSTQFGKETGPGTLASVTDIAGPGVQFNFTGLDPSSGTVVGDNFPVSSLAGGAYKTYGVINTFSTWGDFSAYTKYRLLFSNVGTNPVTVNLKINTGWTIPPPEYAAAWRDTFWQNTWTYIEPGVSKNITLDFSSAEVYNAGDEQEFTQYPDGTTGVAVWRLDEVSDIGFQILGNGTGSIIVNGYPVEEEEFKWPPLPTVQTDKYIVTGGEMDALVQLQLGPLPLPPLGVPFVSRPPYITPMVMWQDINFSMPHPAAPVVFLTVPWMSIKSLEHVFFSGTLGYTRIKLLPIPGSDGMGWLYTATNVSDVDIYVVNTFINNTNPPPYNVTNPPQIPIALWTGPSPMSGALAAIPTQTFYPFPDPGPDYLPGFLLSPGGQDDGFGDGVPDPAGSSVLFLPLQMSVESWNGTAWEFTFGGPFVLPMTTGTAFDMVVAPGRALNGAVKTFTGAPWEDVASTGMWGNNTNKKFVTYAYAWSFIQYYLSDGPPIVKLDLVYGGTEKKVKEEHVIADISCDNKVDILDIVIAALSFGAADEGSPATPGYDPTGEGEWPGPYPPYMPALWFVDAQPTLEGGAFDARADLNNDGLIDIIDLVKIAIDFGEEIDP